MEKVAYCPRCDKYLKKYNIFCPFCGSMAPNLSAWEKWDDAKRKEFFRDAPHHEPPKPIEDKTELEKAEAFDKQIKEELDQEAELAKYTPKCPVCGSPDLRKISATSKVLDVAFWGFAAGKPKKTYHCNNCDYEF